RDGLGDIGRRGGRGRRAGGSLGGGRRGVVWNRLELLHRLGRGGSDGLGRRRRGLGRGDRHRDRGGHGREQRDELLVQLADAAEARLGPLVEGTAVEALHTLREVRRGQPQLGNVVVRGEAGEHLA